MEITTVLKPFTYLGITFNKQTNEELIADCPFCEKTDHFYANTRTGQWTCFRCGEKGNVLTFLDATYQYALKRTTDDALKRLADKRGLPLIAIKRWNIAFTGSNYIIPYYSSEGTICNLGIYRFGMKTFPVESLPTTLIGLQRLSNDKNIPIYFCEGPWDTIALDWLLWRTKKPGISIGIPGKVFKQEWTPYFNDRENLNLISDNDESGLKLEAMLDKLFKNKTIHTICWPRDKPLKYDLNDFVTEIAVKQQSPMKCYGDLSKYVNGKVTEIIDRNRPSLESILDAFSQWLYIDEQFRDGITLTLATILSCKLPGNDPVWLLLVGPPSSGKSKTIESARLCKGVYYQSTLRKQALISGLPGKKGMSDPSLIPRLNGKCLLIKDLTEVLCKHQGERDEIFSTLRGAFDTETDLDYGNFVGRRYVSKFSIVAAVTREIYAYDTSSLGERFIRYNIVRKEFDIDKQQEKALYTGLFGDELKLQVQKLVSDFIDYGWKFDPYQLATMIPQWFRDKIKAISRMVASLRTTVRRYDRGYMQNEIIYQPQLESPNRLAVQLQRLGLSIAIIQDKKEIDSEIYNLLRKVALDCLNMFIYDICQFVHANPGKTVQEISNATKISITSVSKYTDDLCVLGLLNKNQQYYYGTSLLGLLWENI